MIGKLLSIFEIKSNIIADSVPKEQTYTILFFVEEKVSGVPA